MAVNVPVEFRDESTWVRYFREQLGTFYAALAGFLEARRDVLVLGGGVRSGGLG